MKRLLKRLAPFAPDQSGAVSVLFELGGLVALCDAGGCTGNVCGFDEPRWFTMKCALFSAALRDMDAVMGRDDKLVAKFADAMREADAPFGALVGTPVPAVIGTDFRALRRMAEKRTGKPVIALAAAGTGQYDRGEEEAYLELFRTFAEPGEVVPGRVGAIGATPLELSVADPSAAVRRALAGKYQEFFCYNDLEEIRRAGSVERNLVLSPAGLAAAEFLRDKFGTPFVPAFPTLPRGLVSRLEKTAGKVLIVHQQFAANALREQLTGREAVCASFFRMSDAYMRPGDRRLTGEEDFVELVRAGGFAVIAADPAFRRLVPEFAGEFVDFPHFAVSGTLTEEA